MIYILGNNENIKSNSINNAGNLKDDFGYKKNSNKTQFNSLSFDIEWKPMKNAKSYALILENYNYQKTFGFPFILWTALNIKQNHLQVNESFLSWKKWIESNKEFYSNDYIWQGYNSTVPETIIAENKLNSNIKGILPENLTSSKLNECPLYIGPIQSNKDFIYTLTIYGLDVEANQLKFYSSKNDGTYEKINKPFYVGDFIQAIDNHVIDKYYLNFKY